MHRKFSDRAEMMATNNLVGGGTKRKNVAKAGNLNKSSKAHDGNVATSNLSVPDTEEGKENTQNLEKTEMGVELRRSFESLQICGDNDFDLNSSFGSLCASDTKDSEFNIMNFVQSVYGIVQPDGEDTSNYVQSENESDDASSDKFNIRKEKKQLGRRFNKQKREWQKQLTKKRSVCKK